MRRAFVVAISLVPCLLLLNRHSFARELSFEDRVKAQEAIERVYWVHRTWPTENRGPKPRLESVLSGTQIRARVEDYLRKSNALAEIWSRPITAQQLQAEMKRMAVRTRAPEMLREIFAALGNDPFLIAETLARQTLADRLIHSFYAGDDRFHGRVRSAAEAALSGVVDASQLKALGAEYAETTWRLKREAETPAETNQEIALDAAGWHERLDRVERVLVDRHSEAPGGVLDAKRHQGRAIFERLPLMTIGRLYEENGAYRVTAVLWKGADAVTTGTASWPKTAFDAWWADRRASAGLNLAPAAGEFTRVEIEAVSGCVQDTWTPTSAPPDSHPLHTLIWTGSEMITWGGHAPDGVTNMGARYDPSTDSWAATATSGAPAGRSGHSAVWTGSEMIVWGGSGRDGITNTGARYSPATDSWTATSTGSAPTRRTSHTAVWTGSEMIAWGGYDAPDYLTPALSTGGRYDPSNDRWVPTTTHMAPAGRQGHTALWTGIEMIVWAGYPISGGQCCAHPFNSGGRYNPSTDSWVMTTMTGAPAARNRPSAVWTGSEMIIWGGMIGGGRFTEYVNSGARYSPLTDSWVTTTTSGAPSGRSGHVAVWTGSEMIVWGGYPDRGCCPPPVDSGGRYNPSTDSWVMTTITGAPAARNRTSAVWTGSEMIVWGGETSDNSGGRYSPATDSWVATSTSGAPPAREGGYTAVWTGSEMVIWGGYVGMVGPVNTGGRYNPSTDSWVTTATAGAPGRRYTHLAAWTGSEMIVWGGYDGDYLNDGGRYNPSADNWLSIAASAVSGALSGPSAVWTGSEMIVWGMNNDLTLNHVSRYNPFTDRWVMASLAGAPASPYMGTVAWTGSEILLWGGSDGTTVHNDGFRYNPSNNSWAAITTNGAPSARCCHTAVWTGSEMIVWGGYDGGGRTDTGGRYNPSTDSWVATTTSGAPTARTSSPAVWTGKEMIVWSGELPGFTPPNTGGRYDPSTDTWKATSVEGAPSGRYGATAVWTGSEMIVWGGSGLNSGGRYCASSCASPVTWYRDGDRDGYGTTEEPRVACDQPADFVSAPGDCDDASAAIHPGGNESCDGLDDDCNGAVDDQPVSDLSCDDANECTIDACRSGACAHFPAIIPVAACAAEPSILNLVSNGRAFGLTVFLTDRCSGQALDPMGLAPLYVSAVGSPTLGRFVLPTPDTGPGCTQDGIWETVPHRQATASGTMTTRFQAPSDGLCGTLDGNRQDIAGLLVNAREAEAAEISFAASYPGAADRMHCAATVTVRGVKSKGRQTP